MRAHLPPHRLRRQCGRRAVQIRLVKKLMKNLSPFQLIRSAQQRVDRLDMTKHNVRVFPIERDQPRAPGLQRRVNRLHRLLRRGQITTNQHVNVIRISRPVHPHLLY